MMKHENFQPQAGAHKPRLFKRTKRAHMNGKARLADMPELILEDMDESRPLVFLFNHRYDRPDRLLLFCKHFFSYYPYFWSSLCVLDFVDVLG